MGTTGLSDACSLWTICDEHRSPGTEHRCGSDQGVGSVPPNHASPVLTVIAHVSFEAKRWSPQKEHKHKEQSGVPVPKGEGRQISIVILCVSIEKEHCSSPPPDTFVLGSL